MVRRVPRIATQAPENREGQDGVVSQAEKGRRPTAARKLRKHLSTHKI